MQFCTTIEGIHLRLCHSSVETREVWQLELRTGIHMPSHIFCRDPRSLSSKTEGTTILSSSYCMSLIKSVCNNLIFTLGCMPKSDMICSYGSKNLLKHL
uniref:Uncharacterized protein n=1 Tax=Arundo donax TaxID=35708 RepID=A0A0A9C0I5_ARUDO